MARVTNSFDFEPQAAGTRGKPDVVPLFAGPADAAPDAVPSFPRLLANGWRGAFADAMAQLVASERRTVEVLDGLARRVDALEREVAR